MAIMTFNLEHGLQVGDSAHFEVGLRELTPSDIFDAQMASEKVGLIDGRPYAYVSNTQMGMELLCRQVEYIGSVQGPFTFKELMKLAPQDFSLLQQQAQVLDDAMLPEETLEALESRGRT
ncbi:TPA: phage tail assembly protein [Vibrio parahaemolyticus]